MPECFQAIGFDEEGVFFCSVERAVCHQKYVVFFDGFDDGLQVFQTFGDFFEYESVFDGEAVNEDIVDGERLEQPVLGGFVFEDFGIADEVLVLLVAVYVDAEHVFDLLSNPVEGCS